MKKVLDFTNFLENSIFKNAFEFFLKKEIDFYIVGGAIRDFLLGKKEIKDLDILLSFNPAEIINELSRKVEGFPFLLDKERKEWRIVIKNNFTLDIGEIEKDIETDLSNRDFTINSITIKYPEKVLIDKFGGIGDIRKKIVRAFKKENLIKDPLRMLRAFRFMATFKFEIEGDTLNFISENKEKILESARERIMRELYIIFSEGEKIYETILKMKESGLLFVLVPELKNMEGSLQVYKDKSLDVLFHTLNCVYYLERFYKNYKRTFFKKYEKDLKEIFEPENRFLLFLSIIFHDIGKPLTRTFEDNRTRFIGHDKVGANIAYRWAKDFRFSEKFAKKLKSMVYFHMYPHLLGKEEEITKRAIFRYLKKTGDLWLFLFVHAYADFRATPPGKNPGYLKNLLKKVYDFKLESEKERPLPLINGYDLINLGLTPGPIFRKILNEVEELRAEGVLKTKEEALIYVRKNYLEEKEIT
ncbi:MAG: HD domain-containing protein [candidate division WOR-3 bacterium]